MVLKIHHVPGARSTRPLWLYYELQNLYNEGLPHMEVIHLNMEKFRVEKPKDFLELNPNGKVPLLQDTDKGVVMWESCGITYYLLDLYDPEDKLGPRKTDPKFLALLHQFIFYSSGTLDELAAISSPIQMVLEEKKPGLNPNLISMNCKAFNELCGPLLAQQLGTSKFMNGDSFTALDIIISYSLLAIKRKVNHFLDNFQTLREYIDRMEARPAYQKSIQSS